MKWGMLSIQSSTVLCLSSFGIWATPVNSFCHDIFDDGWWSYTSQTYRILPLIYIINKKDWLVKVGMKHNWELLVIPNLVETKLVKLEVTFVCLDMVQPMGFSLFYKGAVPGLQVRYCRAVIQDVMPPNDHWSFLIYIYFWTGLCPTSINFYNSTFSTFEENMLAEESSPDGGWVILRRTLPLKMYTFQVERA